MLLYNCLYGGGLIDYGYVALMEELRDGAILFPTK